MKKFTFLTSKFIAILIFLPGINFSQMSIPSAPGTIQNQPFDYCIPCTGAKWINPENVKFTDNLLCSSTLQPYLYCYQDQCYWSRYLDCQNFGFSIPSGAIIKGIQVDLTCFSNTNSAVIDAEVYLLKNNIISGVNKASADYWPTVSSLRSYGGNTELWGTAWTATDIDSSRFGVYIKVKNMTTSTPNVYIDGVSITVSYEMATGIFSQTANTTPLTIYNNSSSEELHVNYQIQNRNNFTRLILFDVLGNECFSKVLDGNRGQEKINTSGLKNGVYFVSLQEHGKMHSKKIILTR